MLNFSRISIIGIILVCILGLAAAAPNFLSQQQAASLPGFLPSKQLTLGLDLQGGAHLLLEVETEAVITDRLDSLVDDIDATLRQERLRARRPRMDGRTVIATLRSEDDAIRAMDLLKDLEVPIQSGVLGGGPKAVLISRDGNSIRASLTSEGIAARIRSAIDQSVEVVRNRIDETGVREPTIQKSGSDRILVQVPGLSDTREIKELLDSEARLTFHLVDVSADPARNPPGTRVVADEDGAPLVIERRVRLTGDNLEDAQPGFNPDTGLPIVTFRFDFQGSRIFADLTSRNIGRPFAILLDDEVISAPTIQSAIRGGSGYIEGNFSIEETVRLSALLRAGALPAPLKVVEERTVGADLGADSIQAGKIAALIGMAAVVVYIVISYGLFGVAANVALTINISLIIGALSALGATLTLPGIAGIVLTIGMAVDANVLVFERIREEVRAGKKPFQAIDNGYRQALSTIFDANITTLIAAALLYQFGSGPVKGFAVTLGIGILTSVFTAVVLTRMFLSLWMRWTRPKRLPI